jgi:hypothetical protein
MVMMKNRFMILLLVLLVSACAKPKAFDEPKLSGWGDAFFKALEGVKPK